MKNMVLVFGIGTSALALAGCAPQEAKVTNGGIPPSMVHQVGVLSANHKAQTGSIIIMNKADMPAALAKKMPGAGAH